MALGKGASKLKSALMGGEYEDDEESAPESSPMAEGPEALLDEMWEALQSKDKEGFGKALHEYVLACAEGAGSSGGAGVTVVKV